MGLGLQLHPHMPQNPATYPCSWRYKTEPYDHQLGSCRGRGAGADSTEVQGSSTQDTSLFILSLCWLSVPPPFPAPPPPLPLSQVRVGC